MLTPQEIESKLKAMKPELSRQFYVSKIGYFGSFARGEQQDDSDVDILVEFQQPLGWEYFDLKDILEKAFQRKVDLVSIEALRPQLKASILSDTKFI